MLVVMPGLESNAAPSEPAFRSDDQIVDDLRARREEGLRALLAKHGEPVRKALAAAYRHRSDLVESALTHAAHQLWQSADKYDSDKGTLRRYFKAIASYELLRELRAEKIEREFLALLETDAAPGGPSVAQRHLVGALRVCIGKLAPLQQAIILADLQHAGSAPAAAIAEAFGTSANSVWRSRHKAHERLRACLERKGFSIGEARVGENDEAEDHDSA